MPSWREKISLDLYQDPIFIARGSYGDVYRAKDKNDDEVVIKGHIVDEEIDFIGSIRELDILRRYCGHPHIINLKTISSHSPFTYELPRVRQIGRKRDLITFVFEPAQYDLSVFLGEKDINYAILKNFMYHMLLGLEYFHGKGFIHLDIKPCNILIVDETAKLCDFGMSLPYTRNKRMPLGTITSWYRAPEICLRYSKYNEKVDLWSLGCVFYEMLSRTPLLKGTRSLTKKPFAEDNMLIRRIWRLLPKQPERRVLNKYNTYNLPLKTFIYRKSWQEQINLNIDEIIKFNSSLGSYDEFIDLLSGLLEFNPAERLSATQALNHPFFSQWTTTIMSVRDNFPPIHGEIRLSPSRRHERLWIWNLAIFIFQQRRSIYWYRHQILFQALDLMERYLEKKSAPLSLVEVTEKFFVCLYLYIKYFAVLADCPSFREIVPEAILSHHLTDRAQKFEFEILGIFDKEIYRPTLYEIGGDLGEIWSSWKVGLLLSFGRYLPDTIKEPRSIREVYQLFVQSLNS